MAEQDMKQANQSYAGFITMLKWGTVVTAFFTVVVILLIAS